jgi:hypothetical protein
LQIIIGHPIALTRIKAGLMQQQLQTLKDLNFNLFNRKTIVLQIIKNLSRVASI